MFRQPDRSRGSTQSVLSSVSKLPPGLDTTPVTVVVLLGGDPVATVQEAAGRRLSRGEKDGVKGQRRNEQSCRHLPDSRRGRQDRRHVPERGQRHQGADPAPTRSARCARFPASSTSRASTPTSATMSSACRASRRLRVWAGVPRFRGEGIKVAIIDTGHRLHARQLRRPGHRRRRSMPRSRPARCRPIPRCSAPPRPRSRAASIWSATTTTPTRSRSSYQPIPHPDPNPLDCNGARLARRRHGGGLRRHVRTARPTPAPTITTTYSQSASASAPASRRRPISTRCASSAARARPMSSSRRSTGRSTTTWTSSTCRSAPTSARPTAPMPSRATTRSKAGVVVVASAGNAGDLRYITGSPASSTRAISVAATETIGRCRRQRTIALPAAAAGDCREDDRGDQRQRRDCTPARSTAP